MTRIQKFVTYNLAMLVSGQALRRDEGQTLAEYALILALIAVAAVLAVTFLGGKITDLFSNIGKDI